MARPRKLTPTVRFDVRLPQDLAARLQLALYSPITGGMPHGALSEFFAIVLREHFRQVDLAQGKGATREECPSCKRKGLGMMHIAADGRVQQTCQYCSHIVHPGADSIKKVQEAMLKELRRIDEKRLDTELFPDQQT